MPVYVYQGKEPSHQHEIVAFRKFVQAAKKAFSNRQDNIYILGGVDTNGTEHDLIIMKEEAIIFADFKHYEGDISGTENGPWNIKTSTGQEVEVKGGSSVNPVQQINKNRSVFVNYFKRQMARIEYFKNKYPKIDEDWENSFWHATKVLVIFTAGDITTDKLAFIDKKRYIDVTDLNQSLNVISDCKASFGFKFKPADLEAMIKHTGVQEYEDYSIDSLTAETSENLVKKAPAKQPKIVSETKKTKDDDTHTYANGSQYIGGWEDGKAQGQGTLTYPNGDQYIGEFKRGKRHGQGIHAWAVGGKYVGDWKDDRKNGQGTYTSKDGSWYVGEWRNDLPNGQGTREYSDGTKNTGEWIDNKPVGDRGFEEPGKAISEPAQVSIIKVTKVPGATFNDKWWSNMYEIQTDLGTYVTSTRYGDQGNLGNVHITWEDMVGTRLEVDANNNSNYPPTINKTTKKTYLWIRSLEKKIEKINLSKAAARAGEDCEDPWSEFALKLARVELARTR